MKQTDGYIEDKKNQIKRERKVFKYGFVFTIPIIIFIPVLVFGILMYQSPDKWQKTEIVARGIGRPVPTNTQGLGAETDVAHFGSRYVSTYTAKF